MIRPYTAVGLIPTVRGIRRRKDIQINLDHLSHLVKAASWLSSLDLPVRLIAFPEGALQAFNDEVLDLDQAIVYPARDEDELGAIAHAELARELNVPAKALANVEQNMIEALAHGLADKDFSAAFTVQEERAGVKLRT